MEIVCVEALSLWCRTILLLVTLYLEIISWFVCLFSQLRVRGFDSSLVRASAGLSKEAIIYGMYS